MSYKTLLHSEAQQLLSSNADLVIIDVRDKEAYEKGHIPGAQHLAMDDLTSFCQNNESKQSLLVYCYHGISSRAVAQHLTDQGFDSVYSLNGGF